MACLSILQVTDLHILPHSDDLFLGINTEHYFDNVLNLAFSREPKIDLILLTGDLAQDPTADSYQRILNRIESTQTPCICLPGNHDNFQLMQRIFNTEWVSCQKQNLFENWQIINLNSQIINETGGHLPNEELRLLEKFLNEQPDLNTLIAVHHHCISTQSTWLDTMQITNSAEFLDIIKQFPKVKIVTTGHIHQEMNVINDGVLILGTPSTCFQFKPKNHDFSLDTTMPGYRVINLYDNGKFETEVTRLSGLLDDLDMTSIGY